MAARRTGWRLRCGVRIGNDPVRGQDVLFHPEGVLLLNETASAVLALCDGTRDTAGLTTELNRKYSEVPLSEIESFLISLADRGLLQPGLVPIGPAPWGRRYRDG